MFSDHPDAYVEFLGSRYHGKEGIKRLYQGRFQASFVKGRNGPVYGWLLDHIMMQDIIDVDPSGTHAWCRMRALMQAGTHESIEEYYPRGHRQWWEGGLYENEYIKENGVWKLFRYRYFPFWHAEHEKGWSHTKKNYVPWPTVTYPEDPLGPTRSLSRRCCGPIPGSCRSTTRTPSRASRLLPMTFGRPSMVRLLRPVTLRSHCPCPRGRAGPVRATERRSPERRCSRSWFRTRSSNSCNVGMGLETWDGKRSGGRASQPYLGVLTRLRAKCRS